MHSSPTANAMPAPTPTTLASKKSLADLPTPKLARIAGVLYAIIIVCGIASEAAIRGDMIVAGDAARTAANIAESPGLFRLSIALDVVMAMADVALAGVFFVLLKRVGPTLATLAMVFRLTQTALIGASLLLLQGALLLSTGAPSASGVQDPAGLALLLIDGHAHGYDLGLFFFGLNSVFTGILLARHQGGSKVIGTGLALAGLVYLIGSTLRFFAPALSEAFSLAYAIPLLAETAVCGLLLSSGLSTPTASQRPGDTP